jgi:hypothetical protein
LYRAVDSLGDPYPGDDAEQREQPERYGLFDRPDQRQEELADHEPRLTAMAMATARPRMGRGNISLITVHTTGPIEKAKQMMKPTSASRVTMVVALVSPELPNIEYLQPIDPAR